MNTNLFPQESINEIIIIAERNQSKCNSFKNIFSSNCYIQKDLSVIIYQFMCDMSFDLRKVIEVLNRFKIYNNNLLSNLQSSEMLISEYNSKILQLQNDVNTLETKLNKINMQNAYLEKINKSHQNYIDDLIFKLKCHCNKCSCCQSFQTRIHLRNNISKRHKSMFISSVQYDFSENKNQTLNRIHTIDNNKFNTYYNNTNKDILYHYNTANFGKTINHRKINIKNDDTLIKNGETEKGIHNKNSKVQKLIMEIYKDDNILKKLKYILGKDFETKLVDNNVSDLFLNQLEQALIKINKGSLSNMNSYSEKMSKRILIAQKVKEKKRGSKSLKEHCITNN